MVHCVWGLCSNNDKYNKVTCKRPRSDYVGTTWIPWPKDTQQLQNWINACGTENLRKPTDITRSKRICSLHFVGGKGPTTQYPDPVPCVKNDVQITSWLQRNKRRRTLSYPGQSTSANDDKLQGVGG